MDTWTKQDWLTRFKSNMPFSEGEMFICNLPKTQISQKIERGERLTADEASERKADAQSDVFVYAGFVQPGKHQIVIKDQKTQKWYARPIMVDPRRRDIISCHSVENERQKEAIKRFSQVDDSGNLVARIDLDNSVFMNFKRYTKQDVQNCFSADMAHSRLDSFITDEEDVSTAHESCNFTSLTFSHTAASLFTNFPAELSVVLHIFP